MNFCFVSLVDVWVASVLGCVKGLLSIVLQMEK